MTGRRTAIVGLGKIAWAFDLEPGRTVVWTHLGAYEAHAGLFQVVGAVEPDAPAQERFAEHRPQIPVFDTIDALAALAPEVVSLCTPGPSHAELILRLLAIPTLRVIWCEKPLALALDDAERVVVACAARDVRLVVSHVRRWVPLWTRFADIIARGDIGSLRWLRVSMPNRLWSIGSHALDLALMLGGPAEAIAGIDVPALEEDGEPARPALIRFASGAAGVVETMGMKSRLVVRAEAFGDDGHLAADELAGTLAVTRFIDSPRYDYYKQLGEAEVERLASLGDMSPFTAIALEIDTLLRDPSRRARCEGSDALAAMRLLDTLSAIVPHTDGTTP